MRKKKSFDPRVDYFNKERYKGGVYYDCRFDEMQPEPETRTQKILAKNKEKHFVRS